MSRLTVNSTEKACNKCEKTQNISMFDITSCVKNGKRYEYVRNSCRDCGRDTARKYGQEHANERAEYSRKYRLENPEKVSETNRKTRKKHSVKIRAYKAEYLKRDYVKELKANWDKKYRESHKEEIKFAQRKYYHKSLKKDKDKEWRYANPEKARGYRKKWEENNPEKVEEKRRKEEAFRRTAKKITDLTGEYLLNLKNIVGNTCPYCEQKTEKLHLDHIIPLIREGMHTKDNVMYCCPTCNLRKGRKTLEEFDNTINLQKIYEQAGI